MLADEWEGALEIFTAGSGSLLHYVYDPARQEYFTPLVNDATEFGQNQKQAARMFYMLLDPSARPEDFDAAWPHLWKLHKPRQPGEPVTSATAVLDTGMLARHPVIRTNLWKTIDFTGGSGEDTHGHGTIVTLELCVASPVRTDLINLRISDGFTPAPKENLIRALEALIQIKQEENLQHLTVNLSGGVYSRRLLGALPCDGACDVCKTALRVAEYDIFIVAAAGNTPGKTACPAVAGLRNPKSGILAVGSSSSPTSGAGSIYAPGALDTWGSAGA